MMSYGRERDIEIEKKKKKKKKKKKTQKQTRNKGVSKYIILKIRKTNFAQKMEGNLILLFKNGLPC